MNSNPRAILLSPDSFLIAGIKGFEICCFAAIRLSVLVYTASPEAVTRSSILAITGF
jgi:hypothetical protein